MLLDLPDGKGREVEDGGGQHGRGVAFPYPFYEMVELAGAARRHDRDRNRVGHGPREREIEAVPRPVAIHRREEDFAGPEPRYLLGVGDRVQSGRLTAAVGEDFPAWLLARG